MKIKQYTQDFLTKKNFLIIAIIAALFSFVVIVRVVNNRGDEFLSEEFISTEKESYHCPGGGGLPYAECYCSCLDKSKKIKSNYESCIMKEKCDRIN